MMKKVGKKVEDTKRFEVMCKWFQLQKIWTKNDDYHTVAMQWSQAYLKSHH